MEGKVQALSQALHLLGYTVTVPNDLLLHPNFAFVADCFAWLCQRIDPEVVAPRDYGTEQKRAGFLTALGSQLYTKTRVKVNIRRLYRASGTAVNELLTLTTALLDVAQQPNSSASTGVVSSVNHVAHLQQSRAQDRFAVQQLAQSIAVSGQQLVGTLSSAPAIFQQLNAALSAGSDVASLKAEVRAAMVSARAQIAMLRKAIAEMDQEQQSLEAKVEKRHVELDRMERRLDALHAIKPAQSEEVDKLEVELAELYKMYLHKFRNLEYLEGQLDKYNALQEAKAEEADKAMRKIQRQMREEEARVLQGDQNGDPNNLGNLGLSEDSEADFGAFQPKALPRLGAGLGAGHGAMSNHLLLVPDDSTSSSQPAARLGSGHVSSSSFSTAAGVGRPSGKQSGLGSARPSSAGSKRPSSAARRANSGGGSDVLVVEDMQRLGIDNRGSGLTLREDNDF